MRLHILVEGPSEAVLLREWLPRFLPSGHSFTIIQHRGKGHIPGNPARRPNPNNEGLLDQLPAKLRAYGKSLMSDTDRVVVLVDLDNDNCHDLKNRLIALLKYCKPKPVVLFRIAIEETEAFYLGDWKAIKAAFPKAKYHKLRGYEQDSICGTWEQFQQIIGAPSEDKVEWAKLMGPHLTTLWSGPKANKSPSFCQFCRGLLRLAGELEP